MGKCNNCATLISSEFDTCFECETHTDAFLEKAHYDRICQKLDRCEELVLQFQAEVDKLKEENKKLTNQNKEYKEYINFYLGA